MFSLIAVRRVGGIRRIHLEIFQQGTFFTLIQTGETDHAVERADPAVSVKVRFVRR
ncbi:hypothetical protein LTSEURB_5731, partial [Salmonella enterica subsp. enterica serovar Urbana str. R8-2977]